jgi:hypothetical protein
MTVGCYINILGYFKGSTLTRIQLSSFTYRAQLGLVAPLKQGTFLHFDASVLLAKLQYR